MPLLWVGNRSAVGDVRPPEIGSPGVGLNLQGCRWRSRRSGFLPARVSSPKLYLARQQARSLKWRIELPVDLAIDAGALWIRSWIIQQQMVAAGVGKAPRRKRGSAGRPPPPQSQDDARELNRMIDLRLLQHLEVFWVIVRLPEVIEAANELNRLVPGRRDLEFVARPVGLGREAEFLRRKHGERTTKGHRDAKVCSTKQRLLLVLKPG